MPRQFATEIVLWSPDLQNQISAATLEKLKTIVFEYLKSHRGQLAEETQSALHSAALIIEQSYRLGVALSSRSPMSMADVREAVRIGLAQRDREVQTMRTAFNQNQPNFFDWGISIECVQEIKRVLFGNRAIEDLEGPSKLFAIADARSSILANLSKVLLTELINRLGVGQADQIDRYLAQPNAQAKVVRGVILSLFAAAHQIQVNPTLITDDNIENLSPIITTTSSRNQLEVICERLAVQLGTTEPDIYTPNTGNPLIEMLMTFAMQAAEVIHKWTTAREQKHNDPATPQYWIHRSNVLGRVLPTESFSPNVNLILRGSLIGDAIASGTPHIWQDTDVHGGTIMPSRRSISRGFQIMCQAGMPLDDSEVMRLRQALEIVDGHALAAGLVQKEMDAITSRRDTIARYLKTHPQVSGHLTAEAELKRSLAVVQKQQLRYQRAQQTNSKNSEVIQSLRLSDGGVDEIRVKAVLLKGDLEAEKERVGSRARSRAVRLAAPQLRTAVSSQHIQDYLELDGTQSELQMVQQGLDELGITGGVVIPGSFVEHREKLRGFLITYCREHLAQARTQARQKTKEEEYLERLEHAVKTNSWDWVGFRKLFTHEFKAASSVLTSQLDDLVRLERIDQRIKIISTFLDSRKGHQRLPQLLERVSLDSVEHYIAVIQSLVASEDMELLAGTQWHTQLRDIGSDFRAIASSYQFTLKGIELGIEPLRAEAASVDSQRDTLAKQLRFVTHFREELSTNLFLRSLDQSLSIRDVMGQVRERLGVMQVEPANSDRFPEGSQRLTELVQLYDDCADQLEEENHGSQRLSVRCESFIEKTRSENAVRYRVVWFFTRLADLIEMDQNPLLPTLIHVLDLAEFVEALIQRSDFLDARMNLSATQLKLEQLKKDLEERKIQDKRTQLEAEDSAIVRRNEQLRLELSRLRDDLVRELALLDLTVDVKHFQALTEDLDAAAN